MLLGIKRNIDQEWYSKLKQLLELLKSKYKLEFDISKREENIIFVDPKLTFILRDNKTVDILQSKLKENEVYDIITLIKIYI